MSTLATRDTNQQEATISKQTSHDDKAGLAKKSGARGRNAKKMSVNSTSMSENNDQQDTSMTMSEKQQQDTTSSKMNQRETHTTDQTLVSSNISSKKRRYEEITPEEAAPFEVSMKRLNVNGHYDGSEDEIIQTLKSKRAPPGGFMGQGSKSIHAFFSIGEAMKADDPAHQEKSLGDEANQAAQTMTPQKSMKDHQDGSIEQPATENQYTEDAQNVQEQIGNDQKCDPNIDHERSAEVYQDGNQQQEEILADIQLFEGPELKINEEGQNQDQHQCEAEVQREMIEGPIEPPMEEQIDTTNLERDQMVSDPALDQPFQQDQPDGVGNIYEEASGSPQQ